MTNAIELVAECFEELLMRPALNNAYRQRSKFEGWLKLELGHALNERGVEEVTLEFLVPKTQKRVDLMAKLSEIEGFAIELKTVNTNFRFPGVAQLTKGVTDNFKSVVNDLRKLEGIPDTVTRTRIAAFPVFPVSSTEARRILQLEPHIHRITEAGGRIERQGFLKPPASQGSWGVSYYIIGI